MKQRMENEHSLPKSGSLLRAAKVRKKRKEVTSKD